MSRVIFFRGDVGGGGGGSDGVGLPGRKSTSFLLFSEGAEGGGGWLHLGQMCSCVKGAMPAPF